MNILLTGATGNVGRAIVRRYLQDDLIDLGIITLIARHGGEVEDVPIYPLDLTHSWDHLRLWCKQHKLTEDTKYDLVIMAHGTQKPATLQTMNESDWYSIFYNNLSSTIGFTQALVKEDCLADGSLLVYCSSIQAYTPRAGRGLYAACKAGLEAFGKTVAVELAPKTRCITLRLGQLTQTMGNVVFSPEERAKLEFRALLPWVSPDDVAKLIFDLYNQKSMTGCVLDVDSGHGRNVW